MLPKQVHQLLLFGSAFGAGMMNSVAGGGSRLSFPTLIWLGVPSVAAYATIQRRFDLSAIHARARSPWLSWAVLCQAGVGVYGGASSSSSGSGWRWRCW